MRFFFVSSCLLLLALRPPELRAEETPAAILEHTRSVYAALTSYSDTGTLLKEYSPISHDEYSFATYFTRAPRHFMFDYRKPSDRIVIWGDPDAFHVWWKTTGQVTEFPNPKNTGAITQSEFPTGGATTKIPPCCTTRRVWPALFRTLSRNAWQEWRMWRGTNATGWREPPATSTPKQGKR
jgi:hypothetical protein